MYELPRSLKQIQPKHQGNEHVDIFGAKNSSCVFVKNPESQPAGDYGNVFQKRSDAAYDKYQESLKRPASSHKSPNTLRDDKYTFDSEWCNPKFEHQKTMVNEQAKFPQDYHHQRRLDEYSSSIFVSEEEKQKLRRVYEKNNVQSGETTRNPNQNTNFGRKSTITKEFDDDQCEMRKAMPNYSNLFGLGERNTKSSQQLQQPQSVQPLIPNRMKWEQFDSVLQRGSKDEEVGGNFHKKRYYENMKSSMDTHNNYENYLPSPRQQEESSKNRNPIVVEPPKEIQIEQPAPQTVTYSQNSQKFANQASTPNLNSNSKANRRPQSSARQSSKPTTQITIVKGLTSKFSLPALAQQCKLHSILLAKFNNDIHEGGNTGRGMISVIPQKKYGFENLCSWLRAQGLTIRIK